MGIQKEVDINPQLDSDEEVAFKSPTREHFSNLLRLCPNLYLGSPIPDTQLVRSPSTRNPANRQKKAPPGKRKEKHSSQDGNRTNDSRNCIECNKNINKTKKVMLTNSVEWKVSLPVVCNFSELAMVTI